MPFGLYKKISISDTIFYTEFLILGLYKKIVRWDTIQTEILYP